MPRTALAGGTAPLPGRCRPVCRCSFQLPGLAVGAAASQALERVWGRALVQALGRAAWRDPVRGPGQAQVPGQGGGAEPGVGVVGGLTVSSAASPPPQAANATLAIRAASVASLGNGAGRGAGFVVSIPSATSAGAAAQGSSFNSVMVVLLVVCYASNTLRRALPAHCVHGPSALVALPWVPRPVNQVYGFATGSHSG